MAALDFSLLRKPVVALVGLGSAVFVVVVWAATLFQLEDERARAIDAAVRANKNRAIAYGQYVARTLDAADVATLHLAQRFLDAPLPRVARRPPLPLADPVAANAMFASVVIVDERGAARYSSIPRTEPLDLSDRPVFRSLRARASDRPIISAPRFSPTLRMPVIAISRGVRGEDGRFIGGVWIDIPVHLFTDFNEGAENAPLDMISVIGLDGITLARRTGSRVTFGEDLRGKLVMQRQAADPNGTYLGPSGIDNINRYFSHKRLKDYPVFATVGVGESDVLAGPHARARWYYLGAAALTLAILAFAVSTILGILKLERAFRYLALTNASLRDAQRIGRIGNWEYYPATGRVEWSDQLCEMYGRDPHDHVLTLEEVLAYLDGPSVERLTAALRRAEETGEAQRCEIAASGEGEPSHRRLIFHAVAEPGGRIVKIVGTEQDISVEKAHQHLRDDLAHMERIEAMNTMAGTIAHELAQPLTAASNFLAAASMHAAQRADSDFDALAETLEQARRQVGLTAEIIRRARDMVSSQVEGGGASVAAIIDDALALVKSANALSRVEFVRRIDDAVDQVDADKVQIQQVVMNLLRNACEAASRAKRPRVEITATLRDDETVMICVRDNGPGITAGLADIFSPFASSKSGGLGLGLSISRTIVQAHGGRIWVDTAVAEGAMICVTLPVQPPDAARQDAGLAVAAPQ